jgi:hypothetical protein
LWPSTSIGLQAPSFPHHIAHLRQKIFFLRGGEWHWRILSGDADNGAVKIVEGVFVYDGGDFTGDASRTGMFVQNNNLVSLANRMGDGLAVERRMVRRSKNLKFIPSLPLEPRRPQRGMNHGGISNGADVGTFAGSARLAQRHSVVFCRNFFLDSAIQILCSKK